MTSRVCLCVYVCVRISSLLSVLQVPACLPEPKWAPPETGAGRLWASQACRLQDSEICHLPSQPSDPGQVRPFVFAFSWILSLQVTWRIKGLPAFRVLSRAWQKSGRVCLFCPGAAVGGFFELVPVLLCEGVCVLTGIVPDFSTVSFT